MAIGQKVPVVPSSRVLAIFRPSGLGDWEWDSFGHMLLLYTINLEVWEALAQCFSVGSPLLGMLNYVQIWCLPLATPIKPNLKLAQFPAANTSNPKSHTRLITPPSHHSPQTTPLCRFLSFLFCGVPFRSTDVMWPFRAFKYVSPFAWFCNSAVYLGYEYAQYDGTVECDAELCAVSRTRHNRTSAIARVHHENLST